VRKRTITVLWIGVALFGAIASAAAQIITGTMSGTVRDEQGGVVPGATVTLVSETQGTRVGPLATNEEGIYVFPNLATDDYTVEVSLQGFKTVLRRGVRVSGADRVSVPALVLEAGGVSEKVEVKAESSVVQAASGERSFTVQAAQLTSLPIASRGFRDFANLVPGANPTGGGVLQSGRLGGGGQDNVMIDGITTLDSGNNGLMGGMNIPVDAIAEVRVLTTGYQAEYGRSSGLQVTAVTKSGTNRFSGSLYDVERDSKWNANRWDRIQNGQPKPVVDERDWGYTIGGPVGRPGGSNKLFFFYAHEYRPRTTGNVTQQFRMPTALERRGDFSQTLDQNGALFNLIYDPSSGLPKTACSSTMTTACFQDGGVIGRIPQDRLYGPGLALLNQYPLPNIPQAAGTSFNYTLQTPTVENLTYIPSVRLDYQVSSRLRVTGKWTAQGARVVPNPGVLPDYTDTLQKFPWVHNWAGTVNYMIGPTMFVEGTYGGVQNRLGAQPITDYSNKNLVICPADLAAVVPNCTLGAIPMLFEDANVVDPRYYEFDALAEMGVPFFQDGRILTPPFVAWSVGGTTSRIANTPPGINYSFMNINRTQDVSISLTKLMGRHNFKAGFYWGHSYKAQNQGVALFQGNINFGPDSNNPLDTGYPFANAILGAFSSYGQQEKFIEGNFIFNSLDFYVQDNWKVNPRLTLDYGMRFVHQGPQYDQFGQGTNFFAEQWSLAAAPVLYQPACAGASPCSGASRQARDPRTGQLLGPGTASLIGQAILGSGNFANGMRRAGDGIAETAYTWPALKLAPRFGVAYDVNGQQQLVLRGSWGIFYDRPDGNSVFSTPGNPPVSGSSTSQWGTLSDLDSSRLSFGPVPTISVYLYDSPLPADMQWNGGVQLALPWVSRLGVEYVGHHQYDALGSQQALNAVNINTIDLGTTLRPENQDPTQPAGTPLPDNLLRPFRGYGNIHVQWGQFWRTYHSMQTTFDRRFWDGFSFGVNWTWSISDRGTVNKPLPNLPNPAGSSPLRLDHRPDGSFEVRADQARFDELFMDQGTLRHVVQSNFVWDLPDWRRTGAAHRILGAIVNDWTLAGIFRVDSGQPYDVSYSYQAGGGTALTGSPDYPARVVITGDPGSGCSDDPYKQFNTDAFRGPTAGSDGLESGRYYLTACGNHTLDLAIARDIPLGGSRRLQFRADVFNALNTVIFNGRQTQLQLTNPTAQGIVNNQFLADGSVNPARLTPQTAGFGAVTTARDARSVQLQIRLLF
jgi:hypothetical protein